MNIADLNYLESVSKSSNILGGGDKKKPVFKIDVNYADVDQSVYATALALNFGKKGDATAYNAVYQSANISQR